MAVADNVFDAIAQEGSDRNFTPRRNEHFHPTEALAGSWEKVEELRRRVERGLPLWHELDRKECIDRPYSDATELLA